MRKNILLILFTTFIFSQNQAQNIIYYETASFCKSAMVIGGYNKYKGDIVIPSTINVDTKKKGPNGYYYITETYKVEGIDHSAFSQCDSLESISFPETLRFISSNAFKNCKLLTDVRIPAKVESIGGASVTISSSVTYDDYKYAFSGCENLENIYVYWPNRFNAMFTGFDEGEYETRYSYNFVSEDVHTTVWYAAEDCNIKALGPKKRFVPGAFEVIEDRNFFSTSFSLPPYPEYPNRHIVSITYNGEELYPQDSIYTITNIEDNSLHSIAAIVHDDETGEDIATSFNVKTKALNISLSTTKIGQTTIKTRISATNEKDAIYSEIGVYYDGNYYPADNDRYVIFSNLIPNKTYKMYPYAIYNGNIKIAATATEITTQGLTPQIEMLDLTPTSFTAKGKYANIDATVNETGFTDYDASELLTLTGLDPATKYTIEYYVKTKEGSNEKVTTTFTTPALEMTTLNPKVVSNSCAIVAATTNMSDEETNAGFQWRKYEAPETLPSSEGYAAIYDGQLEGYIKNLQATSFYNVRAFYKSTAGKYYYSDWVTFDPSDFSYFEPTVHTYPTEELTANSAKVKGYVLQGTDAITEQGFVYWPTGTNKANATRSVTVPENASIVIAKGQVMNATLEGLTPSTTYNFCAFVTTASGTIYGEEHSFTTKADETGIESLESEQPTPSIIGYYDLNGRKLSEPQHGITIVRYSDGTARKILSK